MSILAKVAAEASGGDAMKVELEEERRVIEVQRSGWGDYVEDAMDEVDRYRRADKGKGIGTAKVTVKTLKGQDFD